MGYLGDTLKAARPRDLMFFSGYALFLVFSYLAFHSVTLISSAGPMEYSMGVLFSIAAMSARIIVYGIAACVIRFIQKNTLTLATVLATALALVAFLVLAMVFYFKNAVSPGMLTPWLLVGAVLLGAVDALVTLLWARFSSTLTLRAVYLFVVLCNALSLAIYLAATFMPNMVALPITALLLLTSIFFAKRSLDLRVDSADWEYSRPVFTGALRRLWHPVLGTAILCFMGGLMLQISGQDEVPLSSFQQTSLITSALVVLFLLLPALFIRKPFNIGRIYAAALPLSAAGFLLLPLIWNAAGGIVNSFAQLGSMVAGIILWCMIADCAHDTKLPSTLLFALALLCTNCAQLAGTIIGFANAETLKQGDLVLTTVALVAVYLLLMMALFLFKDKTLIGNEEKVADPLKPELLLADRCDSIAKEHQFTPRETETFHLLAQGYTLPTISEKMFVSENTIKSHVKSIYQKLGIHVRAELIDLVNKE